MFIKNCDKLVDFYSILANPYRLKIISLISRQPLSQKEISIIIGLNYMVTYRYLKMMTNKNIVKKIKSNNTTLFKSLIKINEKGEIIKL